MDKLPEPVPESSEDLELRLGPNDKPSTDRKEEAEAENLMSDGMCGNGLYWPIWFELMNPEARIIQQREEYEHRRTQPTRW